MLKYFQRNDRDCLNCCLVALLDIEYEKIPKFYDAIADLNDYTQDELDEFNYKYHSWLHSKGLFSLNIGTKYENGAIGIPEFSKTPFKMIFVLHKQGRKYDHVVVGTLDRGRVYIEHDPLGEKIRLQHNRYSINRVNSQSGSK